MAWEWVPIAGAVGSLLGAGFGGWVGGRQSRKTQERQHQLERERNVATRGLEKADEAIAALRFLQRHRDVVANWRSSDYESPHFERTRDEYDNLGRAVEYLTDSTVREQLTVVHLLIIDTFMVPRRRQDDLSSAEALVSQVCEEGVTILGRYLRNEPPQDLSDELRQWRKTIDDRYDELLRFVQKQQEREDAQS